MTDAPECCGVLHGVVLNKPLWSCPENPIPFKDQAFQKTHNKAVEATAISVLLVFGVLRAALHLSVGSDMEIQFDGIQPQESLQSLSRVFCLACVLGFRRVFAEATA